MKRTIGLLVLFLLFSICSSFADEQSEGQKQLRFWKSYLIGTGGTVPDLWAFSSGIEYAFFRDDYNHEVSFSADIINDRTTFNGQKLLAPVFVNYRWYGGPQKNGGLFVVAGVGMAIPFGLDHGRGSFAWQGGGGYVFSKRFALGLRYIGRQSQTFNQGGVSYSVNNAFIGGMADISFF